MSAVEKAQIEAALAEARATGKQFVFPDMNVKPFATAEELPPTFTAAGSPERTKKPLTAAPRGGARKRKQTKRKHPRRKHAKRKQTRRG